jgi:hypothetical protein
LWAPPDGRARVTGRSLDHTIRFPMSPPQAERE